MFTTIYILILYPTLVIFYLNRIKNKNYTQFVELTLSVFLASVILIMLVVDKYYLNT